MFHECYEFQMNISIFSNFGMNGCSLAIRENEQMRTDALKKIVNSKGEKKSVAGAAKLSCKIPETRLPPIILTFLSSFSAGKQKQCWNFSYMTSVNLQ